MGHQHKILTILFLYCNLNLCFSQLVESEIDSLNTIAKNSTDTTKIHALNGLSEAYLETNADKAIAYANQAMSLSRKYKSDIDLGQSYLNLGRGYHQKTENHRAINYYSMALDIFNQLRDKGRVAESSSALASVYVDMGNFESALDYNLRALKIREESSDSAGLSSSLLNVGLVYYKLKRLEISLEYYYKALKIRTTMNDQMGISSCYNNIANVYGDKGNPEKALEFLEKSLAIKEKLGNKKGLGFTLNNIGAIYSSQENYTKAREYFVRSYEIKKEIGDLRGMASSLGNIGGNYYFTNDKKNAIKYFLMAIETGQKIGAADIMLSNYANVAQTYFEDGNFKAAAEYYQIESAMKDSLYSVESAKSMNEMQAKFDFEKQEKELKISKQKNDIQDLELSRQRLFKNGFIIGFILLLIIALVIYNRYQVKHKANAKLESQKQEITRQHNELNVAYSQIEAKNKDITDSIRYAKRLQLAILPTSEFERTFKQDAFIFYKPKDIVSGDFYWMEEKGDRVMVASVDSTGHGVPGAFMSIVGYNLLNQAVNEHEIEQPSLILDEMNKGVTETLRQYEEESTVKDGMDIALCNINRKTLQLQYAGAYNPVWIVRKGVLTELKGDKFPVGAFIGETINSFQNHIFQLEKGDMIYLFTDGYADQFGGPNGKKFKYKQFAELFVTHYSKAPAEQRSILEKTFDNWIGGLEQVDDLLVIGIRV